MRLAIRNGRMIDPGNHFDQVGDLFIDDALIVGCSKPPRAFKPEQEIDANGKIVCPGMVDLCARLREPGEANKATIASETMAAARAGVTSICYPPDTVPVMDTPAVVELVLQSAANINHAKVYPLGALTHRLKGQSLAEMAILKNVGCIGMSNAYNPMTDTELLRRALEYAATFDITVHLYCEDNYLRNNGTIHEGEISAQLGLPPIPETAETIALSRALLLIEQTGARVHFCRISAARSLLLLAEAKQQGLAITADVGIAYLHLSDSDIDSFNTNFLVLPPFRSQEDQAGLRAGIASGVIDAICSDHQPHDSDAKLAPFSSAAPGASTIEMLLPLTLQLVKDKILTINQAIACLTSQPAKIAALNAGSLAPGRQADICIFDPEASWMVTEDSLLSAGKNTPFLAWEMTGAISHTILDGKIIYKH